MTATFFLVRHASHGLLGRVLAGRMPGVGLSQEGFEEAERLGRRLAGERLTLLQTSPLQRAEETAAPIGRACGLKPQIEPALNEIDFGAWTGRSFDSLHGDPAFHAWNHERATAHAPNGEGMADAQTRIVAHMDRLARTSPDGRIALVSHSDILKAAIAHYLGLSLTFIQRFDIDPASITTLVVGDWGAKLLSLNEQAHLTVEPAAAARERAA